MPIGIEDVRSSG